MIANFFQKRKIEKGRLKYLEEMTKTVRKDILTMIFAAQSGHPGGSLSSVEIVTTLYFQIMRIDPDNPNWPDRDRFILSKGHACPVWYACLAERGFFPVEELLTLREINSRLQGHPDMRKTPGVDFTTGSLGQGLSVGVGQALAIKTDKKTARVYVVLGDGELNEGQVWEAAMSAAKFKLDNLTLFIDYNNLQLDGYCHDVMPIEPLVEKWQAFNWDVQEIDGHDITAIIHSVEKAESVIAKPAVIIAHTIKGKGVGFMEDQCSWHGKAPNREEFLLALNEIKIDDNHEGIITKSLDLHKSRLDAPRRESLSPFNGVIGQSSELRPTRDAYGMALLDLGRRNPNIVVCEADISTSTRTSLFAESFPDRFFQFGIAEANMMAAAAGMAASGKIPFVSTYAVFASMRACEQVRTLIAYPRMNVKIAVSHGGITPANDGVTHQGSEDLGIMRTIPNMTVIMPADFNSTKELVRAASEYDGPVYLRFTRDAIPIIYPENEKFEIGKGKLLKTGSDISLIALGDMVWIALMASQNLNIKGIKADVIDMHTIKPIDSELLLSSANKTKHVISIEDHQINCGLGSAVTEVLSEKSPCFIKRIGLQDTFAESGQYHLLMEKYHMDAKSVSDLAERMLDH